MDESLQTMDAAQKANSKPALLSALAGFVLVCVGILASRLAAYSTRDAHVHSVGRAAVLAAGVCICVTVYYAWKGRSTICLFPSISVLVQGIMGLIMQGVGHFRYLMPFREFLLSYILVVAVACVVSAVVTLAAAAHWRHRGLLNTAQSGQKEVGPKDTEAGTSRR